MIDQGTKAYRILVDGEEASEAESDLEDLTYFTAVTAEAFEEASTASYANN